MHTLYLGRGTAHYGNRATDGEDLNATGLIEKNEEEEEEQEDEDSEETERIDKEKRKNEQGGKPETRQG
jgi:hypothetical protein